MKLFFHICSVVYIRFLLIYRTPTTQVLSFPCHKHCDVILCICILYIFKIYKIYNIYIASSLSLSLYIYIYIYTLYIYIKGRVQIDGGGHIWQNSRKENGKVEDWFLTFLNLGQRIWMHLNVYPLYIFILFYPNIHII